MQGFRRDLAVLLFIWILPLLSSALQSYKLLNTMFPSSDFTVSKEDKAISNYIKTEHEAGGASRNKEDRKEAGLDHDLSITESLCKEIQTVALTIKFKKKRFFFQCSLKEQTDERVQIFWEIPVLYNLVSQRATNRFQSWKNHLCRSGTGKLLTVRVLGCWHITAPACLTTSLKKPNDQGQTYPLLVTCSVSQGISISPKFRYCKIRITDH